MKSLSSCCRIFLSGLGKSVGLFTLSLLPAIGDCALPGAVADPSYTDETQQRLELLEAEVRQLRQMAGAESAVDDPTSSSIELAGYEVHRLHDVDRCMNGASDRFPTVGITGFLHADLVHFNQEELNRTTVGDLKNGADLRRARVGFKGNLSEEISYILEFDFGSSIPLFVDNWINFSEVPGLGNIRIGRWRQPFGMTELTSVKEIAFLERPSIFTFSPFRQTGIGFYDHSADERVTWAFSGYRFPSDAFGGNVGDSGGWGMAGRVTMLALENERDAQRIHLGADYSFHDPSNNTMRFASQPEIQVSESTGGLLPSPQTAVPAFVDTGAMSVQYANHFGVELAGQYESFLVQSEARWVSVKMMDGSTQTFPGAYAQARYLLTGERLPYNNKGGVFGRVIPDDEFRFSTGGLGAWEAAARWSYIDLNGSGLPGPGRRLNDLTFGLNWYLNRFTKFQFNYIRAMLDDPTMGDSTADVFAARTQFDF
ncbi:MAG: porin [Planctomycetaceae bacterium]|nr:porin [Planctomycetaceae bacterium]